MALLTPAFCQDQAYPFSSLRLLASAQASPGVVNSGDLLVTPATGQGESSLARRRAPVLTL